MRSLEGTWNFLRKDSTNSSLEDLVIFIRDQTKILKHEIELGVNKPSMFKSRGLMGAGT